MLKCVSWKHIQFLFLFPHNQLLQMTGLKYKNMNRCPRISKVTNSTKATECQVAGYGDIDYAHTILT